MYCNVCCSRLLKFRRAGYKYSSQSPHPARSSAATRPCAALCSSRSCLCVSRCCPLRGVRRGARIRPTRRSPRCLCARRCVYARFRRIRRPTLPRPAPSPPPPSRAICAHSPAHRLFTAPVNSSPPYMTPNSSHRSPSSSSGTSSSCPSSPASVSSIDASRHDVLVTENGVASQHMSIIPPAQSHSTSADSRHKEHPPTPHRRGRWLRKEQSVGQSLLQGEHSLRNGNSTPKRRKGFVYISTLGRCRAFPSRLYSSSSKYHVFVECTPRVCLLVLRNVVLPVLAVRMSRACIRC